MSSISTLGSMLQNFFVSNLRFLVISQSVCPRLSEPSLMFAGKTRAYRSKVPFDTLG